MKCFGLVFTAIFVLFIGLAFPDNANAGYLDSGAGSSLVQAVVAVAAGCARIWDSFCRALGLRK